MHLHRRIAVPVVVAALCVSGCTGREPEVAQPSSPAAGTVSPAPSGSPTPSPSAVALAPPEPPADLARTDDGGAAAAATYFLELYPYLLATGDFAPWDRLSLPECEFCASTRDYVLRTLAAGGSFEGGALEATTLRVHPRDDLVGGYPVDVDIKQNATIERRSDGQVASSTEDQLLHSQVDVILTNDGWKVLEVSDRAVP